MLPPEMTAGSSTPATQISLDGNSVYRPSPSWFAHNPYGIHGIGHAARVFVWANLIGTQLQEGNGNIDLETVRWAAVLHDVGRLSDGWDRGHGIRSAEWLAANRDRLRVTLADEVIDKVLYCCRWHETADSDIPALTLELVCIKDADGLDRVRINDLNPDFLRSEAARLLVDAAWELLHATQSADDSWEAAMNGAGHFIPNSVGTIGR